MSKYTSGPWVVDLDREFLLDGDHVQVEALTPEGLVSREICSCWMDTSGEDPKNSPEWHEDAANARLISAAPDLLEACKDWIAEIDKQIATEEPGDPVALIRHQYHGGRILKTRRAIAKAEGKP